MHPDGAVACARRARVRERQLDRAKLPQLGARVERQRGQVGSHRHRARSELEEVRMRLARVPDGARQIDPQCPGAVRVLAQSECERSSRRSAGWRASRRSANVASCTASSSCSSGPSCTAEVSLTSRRKARPRHLVTNDTRSSANAPRRPPSALVATTNANPPATTTSNPRNARTRATGNPRCTNITHPTFDAPRARPKQFAPTRSMAVVTARESGSALKHTQVDGLPELAKRTGPLRGPFWSREGTLDS